MATGVVNLTPADIERFWSKVQKTETCWLYGGRKRRYGVFRVGNGQTHRAHRLSWTLANGPIPPELMVCHNCPGGDNPGCVRPDHLFLGTAEDNAKDRDRKGRDRFAAIRTPEWRAKRRAEAERRRAKREARKARSLASWLEAEANPRRRQPWPPPPGHLPYRPAPAEDERRMEMAMHMESSQPGPSGRPPRTVDRLAQEHRDWAQYQPTGLRTVQRR